MPGTKRSRTGAYIPPGVKRTSWTRGARRADARRQRSAWRSRNQIVSVPRTKLAFPQQMKTTLRYVQRVQFQPTGTGVLQARFRANGIYDPDTAVGFGHQPRGFDQFMSIYKVFTVAGSSCSVTFMYEGYDGPSTLGTTGNLIKSWRAVASDDIPALTPMACGLHKGVESLSAGTAETQMEKDRTVWTYINGQSGEKTLKSSMKVSDFYGKDALTGSDGYTGDDSSDPANEVFWEAWCGRVSDDYPAEVTKVVAYVTIEYDVTFTEPLVLTAS